MPVVYGMLSQNTDNALLYSSCDAVAIKKHWVWEPCSYAYGMRSVSEVPKRGRPWRLMWIMGLSDHHIWQQSYGGANYAHFSATSPIFSVSLAQLKKARPNSRASSVERDRFADLIA